MPVISKKNYANHDSITFTFSIEYNKMDRYSSSFYAIPDDQSIMVDSHPKVKVVRFRSGKRILGVPGTTEAEAREDFNNYLTWYVDSKKSVEKFILIDKQAEGRGHWESELKEIRKTKAEIEFSFTVANKTKMGDKVHYHISDYHKFRAGQTVYADRYIVIPFTEARLKACETIVEKLEKINAEIIRLFANEKIAISTLTAGLKLLN